MGRILLAAVGDTRIDRGHLDRRDEDVALTDDDIGHISCIPGPLIRRPALEIRLFPFLVGNAAATFARQVDAGRGTETPSAVHLLQALGMLLVVEKRLADIVEDGITRIGDPMLEVLGAMTRVQPAVLSVRLAQTGPVTRADRGLRRGVDTVFETGKRREA